MMPILRPEGPLAGRRRWPRGRRRHLRRRRTAGRPGPVRRLLLRPPEVLRLRRRAVARPALPGRVERIGPIAATGRWVPASLDLTIALDNSGSTRPTTRRRSPPLFSSPTRSTGCNDNGGLEFSAGRCERSAEILYRWAEAPPSPPRSSPRPASAATSSGPSTSTTDRRRHGGQGPAGQRDRRHRALPQARRNQLRIAMFPAIDPEDVAALCALHQPRGRALWRAERDARVHRARSGPLDRAQPVPTPPPSSAPRHLTGARSTAGVAGRSCSAPAGSSTTDATTTTGTPATRRARRTLLAGHRARSRPTLGKA